MTNNQAPKTNYEQEIIDLHQFFQDYFTGVLPAEDISHFDGVMAEDFTIVAADGRIADRKTIFNIIQASHNQRSDFKIWIEKVVLQQRVGDISIVTYEEWQQSAESTTSRTSTAIFKEDASLPNQLRWLHVHESGLQTH